MGITIPIAIPVYTLQYVSYKLDNVNAAASALIHIDVILLM